MSTGSYVYAKNGDVPHDLIQGGLFMNSFTEDLNLKTMAFELVPDINFSRNVCTINKGQPTPPCHEEDKVNLEEYFGIYVFIEDKN